MAIQNSPARLQYLRDYSRKYRKEKAEARREKARFLLAECPANESKRRGRVCRECGNAVEATSYWYCYSHNKLRGAEEALTYGDITFNSSSDLS